ncbi:MAG: tripartite tricarboxylate transporter permease [Candidatus Puniceispirillales bacterium]
MFEGLIGGFANCFDPINFTLLFLGTFLGLLVGALPGLSSPMAIIILLPVTYSLEALPALLVMIGVYVGTKLGGSFSAILLRTPGTPASACTAIDGFPMAENGQASLALGYATYSSFFGGLTSWIIAVTCIPIISAVALKSSNADIALIGIMGLVMVSAFTRGSMLKGFIGVCIGLLIGSMGMDKSDAIERFTFGSLDLLTGVPFAAALVGLFGFSVVLSDLSLMKTTSQLITEKFKIELPSFKDFCKRWRAWSIGSFFGAVVGAIPGVGADGATWLAYGTVKNNSKNPEKFGLGEPDGVIAPETANNGTTGGAMVPMLTLGIPGDASTAIMIGALYLHGLQPGVTLMKTGAEVVYGMLAGLLLAGIMMFVIAMGAIRFFVYILRQHRSLLFPFVMVFATLGAYASYNEIFPVYAAIFLGVFGFLMEERGFPVVTIVLGVILGPIIEYNTRIALQVADANWLTFIDTWPRIIILGTIIFLVFNEVKQGLIREKLSKTK